MRIAFGTLGEATVDGTELWVKTFVAAIGGASADPNLEHPHRVVEYAEQVANLAVEAAARRGIVVATDAEES